MKLDQTKTIELFEKSLRTHSFTDAALQIEHTSLV